MSATSTVLVAGVGLEEGEAEYIGCEGGSDTGPPIAREVWGREVELVLRPRNLGLLNLKDLTELDEDFRTSPPPSSEASLSVDLFLNLVKGEVLLVVESYRTPEFGPAEDSGCLS